MQKENETFFLQLDAFILSISKYNQIQDIWDNGRFKDIKFEVAKVEFEQYNIIFQEDAGYIRKIFRKMEA